MEEHTLNAFEHFVRHRGNAFIVPRSLRGEVDDDLARTPGNEREILEDAWNRIPNEQRDIYEYCASIPVENSSAESTVPPMDAEVDDDLLEEEVSRGIFESNIHERSSKAEENNAKKTSREDFHQIRDQIRPIILPVRNKPESHHTTTGGAACVSQAMILNDKASSSKDDFYNRPVGSPYDFFARDFCAQEQYPVPNNTIVSAAWEALGEIERHKYEERHHAELARYELEHSQETDSRKRRRSSRLKGDSTCSITSNCHGSAKRCTDTNFRTQLAHQREVHSPSSLSSPSLTQSSSANSIPMPNSLKLSIMNATRSASRSIRHTKHSALEDPSKIGKRLPLRESTWRTTAPDLRRYDGKSYISGKSGSSTSVSACKGVSKESFDVDTVENIPEAKNSAELVPNSTQNTLSKGNPTENQMYRNANSGLTTTPIAVFKSLSVELEQEDSPGIFSSCDGFPFLADELDDERLLTAIDVDDECDAGAVVKRNCKELQKITFSSVDAENENDQTVAFLK